MGILDSIYIFFRGRKIAILGPRASGKTSLYNLILHGTVDKGAPREAAPGPNQRAAARNKALGLTVKKGNDVPGGVREVWKPVFADADIVFYLFDVVRLQDDIEYEREVREDGRLLKEWGVGDKKFTLIGTHTDRDPRSELHDSFGSYTDMLSDLDPVVLMTGRLSGGAGRSDVVRVFGSLDTTDNAEKLMWTARSHWR